MKAAFSLLVATLSVAFSASGAAHGQSAPVPKTNPMKVYMHYMPWFETPTTLGGSNWGYHWKFNNRNPNIVDTAGKRQIASHYYPMIGPYASRDADVIEYHMLLMKLSGVDGVLIDWYGVQGTNGDIGQLLTSSNAIVDRVDDCHSRAEHAAEGGKVLRVEKRVITDIEKPLARCSERVLGKGKQPARIAELRFIGDRRIGHNSTCRKNRVVEQKSAALHHEV